MKINFKSTYTVFKPVESSFEITDEDIKNLREDILDGIKSETIESEDDIRDAISDYLFDEYYYNSCLEIDQNENYDLEIENVWYDTSELTNMFKEYLNGKN